MLGIAIWINLYIHTFTITCIIHLPCSHQFLTMNVVVITIWIWGMWTPTCNSSPSLSSATSSSSAIWAQRPPRFGKPDRIQWEMIEMKISYPIGSMYGIYANIGGILMVNVTIYSIHGSFGYRCSTRKSNGLFCLDCLGSIPQLMDPKII